MLEGKHIVLVEDDQIMGASLVQRLELEGADVQWLRHFSRALPAIRTPRKSIDAVICDIRLPDGSGEMIFEALSQKGRPPPFLFITGQGTIDQAVRLIRSGAADYIVKPFDIGAFLLRLLQIIRPASEDDMSGQTGVTDIARAVDRLVAEAAAGDGPVLIRGASGLGKNRLAQSVHQGSNRGAAPFIAADAEREVIDPEALASLREAAGEGVLLIMGIERLSEKAQEDLLGQLRGAEFRLIATSRATEDEQLAAIRSDLRAVLRTWEIVVPPLSMRPEDAVWLAARLFPSFNRRRPTPLVGIAATAEDAIRAHDWPGNGRELRARLLRGVSGAEGEHLLASDLFPERSGQPDLRSLAEVRDAAERAQIVAALERTDGQVTEAARLLRVSRTTLWEKMQKLGI